MTSEPTFEAAKAASGQRHYAANPPAAPKDDSSKEEATDRTLNALLLADEAHTANAAAADKAESELAKASNRYERLAAEGKLERLTRSDVKIAATARALANVTSQRWSEGAAPTLKALTILFSVSETHAAALECLEAWEGGKLAWPSVGGAKLPADVKRPLLRSLLSTAFKERESIDAELWKASFDDREARRRRAEKQRWELRKAERAT